MNPPMRFPVLLTALLFAACGGGPDEELPEGGVSPDVTERPLPAGAQAISLLGDPLYPPEASEEVRARQTSQLQEALADLETDPGDADALIWVGRRHAYLGDYRRAIETFSQGLALHPEDARFYRHRGHRLITVRELDAAISDFGRAAAAVRGLADEVEPDGQPNALGIPTSTLHFNIWYHFGLAHYLKGEFDQAAEKYRECMAVSEHPDSKIATAHWWYMSLRRAGREDEARALIRGLDLEALSRDVIESGSYLALLRLYRSEGEGEAAPDPESLEGATQGYGLGNWALYHGDTEGARAIFQSIVDARSQWGAFGYIAAEADLARLGGS